MRQLFEELKRRHVFRVAAVYAVVAWVVIQVANIVLPRLQLPGWTVTFPIVLVALGFPIALVVAWAFEMTAEGMRRTPEAVTSEEDVEPAGGRRSQGRLVLQASVGLGLLAAAGAAAWYLMGGGGESPELSERTVAVLPLQVSGSGAETWRDGMVTMLSTGLDGAGQLRAISDRTVFAAWEDRERSGDRAGASTEEALSVAREIGARYGVIGSAVALDDELRLVAHVHESPSGERLGRVVVEGPNGRVTALTDSLTRGLLGLLLEEGGEGRAPRRRAGEPAHAVPGGAGGVSGGGPALPVGGLRGCHRGLPPGRRARQFLRPGPLAARVGRRMGAGRYGRWPPPACVRPRGSPPATGAEAGPSELALARG